MKKIVLLILLLFVANFVFAEEQEETLVIQARISVEETGVLVDDVTVVYGIPSEQNQDGQHILKLLDKSQETVYQLRFLIDEIQATIPEEVPTKEVDDFLLDSTRYEAVVYLPYFEEAEIIAVGEENSSLMAFVGIKDLICNNNSVCESNENFVSCEADCSIEEDNYCYPETDGVCDTDCVEGLDEDCEGTETSGGLSAQGLNLQDFFIPVAIVLIIATIVGYNLIKRKKSGKRK